MRSYLILALRYLKKQRVTSILILIAVILSTMMTAVIGQSVGILSAMRQQQAVTIGGSRYASFVQMSEEQVTAIRSDPRISYAGISSAAGTVEINRVLKLGLTEYFDGSLDAYPAVKRLKEGRLPEKAMEIALPEDVLKYLGFDGKPGDRITLSVSKALRHGIETSSYDYTADFTLTGILESNYLGYAAGAVQGVVGEGTSETVLPPSYRYFNVDIRTSDSAGFQETMDDLTEKLGVSDLDTVYNTVYLRAMGIRFDEEAADSQDSDQGFSFLTAAGVFTGALILFAAGLVIYNILKIAVSGRCRQYGVLRAIGGEKRQLYRIVTAEILLLCTLGIPVGLLTGLLSASGILSAATGLLSPEIFLVQDAAELKELIRTNSSGKWIFLLLSAAITLLFAFLAAVPAARSAAQVSPVTAMSGTGVRIKRRNRRVRKIRSFEAYYARLNLRRNRGRTAVTILSLVMSITVFIALQGFVTLLNAAGTDGGHLGDYSVVNEAQGFSREDLSVLAADENVREIPAMQFSLYELDDKMSPRGISADLILQPGETFQLVGLNESYLEGFFRDQLSDEEKAAVLSGEGCVVRNPLSVSAGEERLAGTSVKAGSTITAEGKPLRVIKTVDGYGSYLSVGNDGFVNGVQVIVSDSVYEEITGNSRYTEILPILKEDADRDAFGRRLEEFCEKAEGTVCVSFEDTDRQIEESFAQINLLAWGLILFVGLIGILNIINTVSTNIHTRKAEIGMQRAVGMSTSSLYRTFLWEGAYYGIISSVIGATAGYICTVLIESAKTGSAELPGFAFLPTAQAALLATAACLLATCIPLRQVSRMSAAEIVGSVE